MIHRPSPRDEVAASFILLGLTSIFLLVLTLAAGGCAATSSYWGDGRGYPYVSGSMVQSGGVVGPVLRVDVHNPLPLDVRVTITCESIYQPDEEFWVMARSTRSILVTLEAPGPARVGGQRIRGCRLAKWSAEIK